ncbi:hypothetical protein FRB95_009379 [Tulasnella sp. JGI-2019a]|nr:hypothetical protein FRB95_009379 [Tulasnella sp. JGI-2019a]
MLRTAPNTGKGPVGNPASSRVWSIHAIEGDCEELHLHWLDKDGAAIPLKATTGKALKKSKASHHFGARRTTDTLNRDLSLNAARNSEEIRLPLAPIPDQ